MEYATTVLPTGLTGQFCLCLRREDKRIFDTHHLAKHSKTKYGRTNKVLFFIGTHLGSQCCLSSSSLLSYFSSKSNKFCQTNVVHCRDGTRIGATWSVLNLNFKIRPKANNPAHPHPSEVSGASSSPVSSACLSLSSSPSPQLLVSSTSCSTTLERLTDTTRFCDLEDTGPS